MGTTARLGDVPRGLLSDVSAGLTKRYYVYAASINNRPMQT